MRIGAHLPHQRTLIMRPAGVAGARTADAPEHGEKTVLGTSRHNAENGRKPGILLADRLSLRRDEAGADVPRHSRPGRAMSSSTPISGWEIKLRITVRQHGLVGSQDLVL